MSEYDIRNILHDAVKRTLNIIRTIVFVGAIAAVVVASAIYYRLAQNIEFTRGAEERISMAADARRDALFAGGLSGLAIIVVLVVLVHAAHRDISAPIQELIGIAKRITAGQFVGFTTKFADDEIGILARALAELAKKTEQAQQLLSERVDEKTRALSEKVREVEQKNIALAETKRTIVNVLDDLRAQETLLRQERDKLNVMLRGIADGVFVIDQWEVVTFWNPAAEALSGVPSADAVGRPYQAALKFVSESDRGKENAFIDVALEKGTVIRPTPAMLLVRKDGREIAVATNAAPLYDARGDILGVVVVFRDVSREREIDRAKSEFISLATHQLRTPLTTMKWIPEMLLEGAVGKFSPKQRKYIDDLRRSSERMIQLINKLLVIARIESRRVETMVEDVDVREFLENIKKDFTREAESRKQRLVFHAPKIASLRTDPRLLSEVIRNLLANAMKYTLDGGCIEVAAVPAPRGRALFTVKDNGIGIPEAQQRRIFGKFFRADNAAKTDVMGTGLGLYLVRRLIDILGGTIEFTSVENKGTTFTVTLPISGPKSEKEGV